MLRPQFKKKPKCFIIVAFPKQMQ